MIYDNCEETNQESRFSRLRKIRRKKRILSSILVTLILVLGTGTYFCVKKYLYDNKLKVEKSKSISKKKSAHKKDIKAKANDYKKTNANESNSNKANALIALSEAQKPFTIDVDLQKQRVSVYDAQKRLVNSFICSSGMDGSDTPKGQYKVQERGYSFYSKKYQEGAYYWVQFMGNYLFHSVPFDKNENIETEEISKLGNKASHGCVRLAINDAKWIYDNVPKGTVVNIK
ncbi:MULTISPECIES: L,D-transpeptidase [Clostridium]|uniref:L,D-transpeptidase n=1 Tax=Clostridium TaxID=1485 RepID=UPI000824FA89|nr:MULTISPECIES: L,D-transpeptidase [Clostridium]PJI09487.1 L,D-transpeptidase [Clostridium sp. CT7]